MNKAIKIVLGIIIVGVLAVAAFVALSWAPDKTLAELAPRYAPPPSQFMDVMGMQVHYRDEGPRNDPEPIVLLHGTSSSLHTWQGWADALKGQRRVIRCDLPGFGLTGPFPDDDYSMPHYVKFVLALMDKLGVQQAVLGGNSFGGEIAWEVAVAAPGHVAKLVLVDAGGYPLDSTSVPIGFRIARTPVLNKVMEYTLPRDMVEDSVRNVYADPAKVTPALVDRYYDLTLRAGNRHALAQRFRAAPSGTDMNLISQVHVPTLILWGEQDRLIPPDNAGRFHQDIAGSEEVLLPGLGHVPQEEGPAASVAVLKHFLAMQ